MANTRDSGRPLRETLRSRGVGEVCLFVDPGDPGLAVYLWHCIEGGGGMPGLDVMDAVT